MENVGIDMEILIHLVKMYDYLYNKKSKNYKDTVMKENAWLEIATTLSSTPDNCLKVWTSLKDKYTRERKKIKNSSSGSGSTDFNNWPYYEDMNFLDMHIQERRKTTSNMVARKGSVSSDSSEIPLTSSINTDLGQEEKEIDEVFEEATEESSSKVAKKRRINFTPLSKSKNCNLTNSDVDNKILETLAVMANNKTTAEEKFGQLIAAELQSIQDENLRKIKKQNLLQVLYE